MTSARAPYAIVRPYLGPGSEWIRDAECAKYDPGLWDAESEKEDHEHAVFICHHCPVRVPCLAAGIKNKETGVWGGVVMRDGRAGQSRRRSPAERPPAVHADV